MVRKLTNHFIANKAIRKDRYSTYNFQYQYLPNEIYEAHCDYTNNENSFGGYWDGDQDWIAVLTEYPGGGKFYHARRQEQDHRRIDFYYTTDGGQTWDNSQGINYINPLTTVDLEGRESPQTLTFVETNPNIIYVSTKNWYSSSDDVSRIYKTTNNGLT